MKASLGMKMKRSALRLMGFESIATKSDIPAGAMIRCTALRPALHITVPHTKA